MMTGKVSQAALAGWRELLPHRELGSMSIFDGHKLDLPNDQGAGRQIALAEFVGFLEAEGSLIKRSDFFWRAGERYDYSCLGTLGEAVLSSKTLGGALRRFATYFPLLQDSSELLFEVGDSYATISYRILDPRIWSRSGDAEFTLGIIAKLIKNIVGEKWSYTDIVFEIDAPKWGHDISDYLKTNCIYAGPTNMIRFPVSWLSLPLNFATPADDLDAELNENLVGQRLASNIRDRTRYQIFKSIGFLGCDQTSIAKEMGMSRRTLRRRLADENLSFQSIVDECRMEVALLELRRRPKASLAEIAFMLGYTEHSSFTRAFSRWSGGPPQQFRCA